MDTQNRMQREIKFRAWHTVKGEMYSWEYIKNTYTIHALSDENVVQLKFMQFTGLKDKNGDKEVYECDIIDSEGNIIGNQYETPALHEDKANLLIQGFGTKDWLTTYTQAVDRGCHDA